MATQKPTVVKDGTDLNINGSPTANPDEPNDDAYSFYSYSEDSEGEAEASPPSEEKEKKCPAPYEKESLEEKDQTLTASDNAPPPTIATAEPRVTEWDPMAADFMSRTNTPDMDPGNYDYADDQYNDDEEKMKLCKFFRDKGICARGNNCRFLHIQTGSSYFTKDEENVWTVAHHELELPEEGTRLAVEIPAVRHPSNFSVVFPNGPNDINDSADLEEKASLNCSGRDKKAMDESLTSLNKRLTKHYKSLPRATQRPSVPLDPGEIVAVQYEADGNFYRARIIDSEEDCYEEEWNVCGLGGLLRITVMLVDFGVITTVSELSVRRIEATFLTKPFQAVECALANVQPYEGDEWSEEACTIFRELTKGELQAFVKQNFVSRLEVELLIRLGDDDWANIGEELKELKLARSVDISPDSQNVSVISIPG